MYAVVNKSAGIATMTFQLKDDDDRLTFIAWLKQLKPRHVEYQLEIGRCIQAAGGEPEHGFPGYDMMQQ